ncbi:hypothetical protein F8S13_10625 [Chloroflexia bacterium SDU3-3]|nr:hypothetical protein F8S13_10625 [Chloroflexia bacterium SDU3-3]
MNLRRLTALLALAAAALTLLTYRALPARPFAADDFQWLIGGYTYSFPKMLRGAFDIEQSHFYRPLIWVAFWVQGHSFGLGWGGFHAASMALHAANAALAGLLVWRLSGGRGWVAGLATCAVAVHPAPFEAVVWISAQSDLLACLWLLLMAHAWVGAWGAAGARREWGLRALAALCMALALLSKESAIAALPLLVLADGWLAQGDTRRWLGRPAAWARYALPALITVVYLAIQLHIEQRNYVVGGGHYGLGLHVALNPLRAIALLAAPLPGSERADAAWLVWLGGALVLALLAQAGAALARRRALGGLLALAALGCTLAPTAPFTAPPNARYLYLPMIVAACAAGVALGRLPWPRGRWAAGALAALAALALAYGAAESYAREQRFAAATGAGGSLFRLALDTCAQRKVERMIVLNPPVAEDHARAAIRLACGKRTTPVFAPTWEIAEANYEQGALIVDFPDGSARIAR